MSPLQSRVSPATLVNRDELDDGGASCSGGAWGCLNTTGQFGVIFSIIVVVIVSAWIYWYTVIRPRQERGKRADQDVEMDLGDGRTVIVSSGPYQRTVVFRGARSPSLPPPAYRPPTAGGEPLVPSDLGSSTGMPLTPQPSPRVSRTPVWPPQPGVAPQTPHMGPRHPAQPSHAPRLQSSQPGMPFQPQPAPLYPSQFMAPGPPPCMMYPQSQPPLLSVIPPPPPPPPPPVVPAQGAGPPRPPPPLQPVPAGKHPRPSRTDNPRRPRAPSPGHASTIEDEESDRDGSLPPPGRRSPSRSPVRNRGTRRQRGHYRHRSPSPRWSPSGGRGRRPSRQRSRSLSPPPRQDRSPSMLSGSSYSSNNRSYKSSTSLDSEMRSGLESLIERAERRKRAREAQRLQVLIDRYDDEEQEAQGDRAYVRQHVADTVPEAEIAPHIATERTRQRQARRDEEVDDPSDKDSEAEQPRRRVTFHQPSLDVLESRVGRRRSPSPSDDGRPTREDIHHGESRVGRRRRIPSPDERIVERPVAPTPGRAESRIGRSHRPSPPRERPASRRGDHGFHGAGESRIGHRSYRRQHAPPPPKASPQEVGATYSSPPAPHGGHPTVDDSLLLNVPRTSGPPSSTGATCGNGSQASGESSSGRRHMMGHYRRDQETRGYRGPPYPGHERDRRQRDSASLEEGSDSDDYDDNNNKGKRGWASKIASFLPTMARMATNNPVAREVAEDIAEEVTGGEGRRAAEENRPARDESSRYRGQETREEYRHPRPLPPRPPPPSPRQRREARRSRDPRRGGPRPPRSSNYRSRHRRRPSTIPEERPESLQLALEHAAEHLAEEAIGSVMDRARSRRDSSDGGASEGPEGDAKARRRSRRSRTEF